MVAKQWNLLLVGIQDLPIDYHDFIVIIFDVYGAMLIIKCKICLWFVIILGVQSIANIKKYEKWFLANLNGYDVWYHGSHDKLLGC